MASRTVLPTERTILQGLSVARWGTIAWAAVTTIAQSHLLRRGAGTGVAVGTIVVLIAFAALLTVWLRTAPGRLIRPAIVAAEIGLAGWMLVADGWVYKAPHAFANGQNLAGSVPLVAAMSAGAALGPWAGAIFGALISLGRLGGAFANGYHMGGGAKDWLSLAATLVFYALAGVVFGLIVRVLRRVETEVIAAHAREDVARTLHDGVLQTLALVERRTRDSDPELAATARRSDRDLRAWIFQGDSGGTLEHRLRAAAGRISSDHDLPISVSVIADDAQPTDAISSALAGAATEAINNAAKHANAKHVIVFAEIDDDGEAFVSIRDDGCGFDPATVKRGEGLQRSIEARVRDIGGRVEIVSTLQEGTEVRLWSK
jgi:signal transduction histidine kinase